MTGSDARSSDKPSLPHRWGEFQPRGTVRRNQRGNRHLAESARRRGWRRPSAEDTKMRTATEVDDYHVETWHELVGEYVRPMEPSPAPGQSFHAWMQVRRMGSIEVLEAGATPYVVHRSPTRECSPGQIFCSLQLSGPHLIAQDGQEILRRPGELAIFDPERPCTLVCREPVNFLAFVFPRQAVGSDLEALVKGAATVLPTGRGVGALLTSFLRQLAKQSGDVQSATAARLAGH